MLLIIDYQVSRMRARSHITCLLLLAIGPTLVVPVEKWHHHEHGAQEREACELCIAAAGAVPNIQPAPSLPPLNLLQMDEDRARIDEDELVRLGESIRSRCAEFGVEGTIEGISPGPVRPTQAA